MNDSEDHQLWLYRRSGVHRFCTRDLWKEVYADVLACGWEPEAEKSLTWLQSAITQYEPGFFFTEEDARSFASVLESLRTTGAGQASDLISRFDPLLEGAFRSGPILILPDAPTCTLDIDTEGLELVYAVVCPDCGFMRHGRVSISMQEDGLSGVQEFIDGMKPHVYCPLCGSKNTRVESFLSAGVDPDSVPSLMTREAGDADESPGLPP
ncbi:MAG: hypothetical protein V2B18_23805 [Pseudomonadota bacterium]